MSRDGFVALPRGGNGLVCLRFVIVVFPDHTHYFITSGPGLLITMRYQNKIYHMTSRASGSEITLCIKIDKTLLDFRETL